MPTTEDPVPMPTGEEIAQAVQAFTENLGKVLRPLILRNQAMHLFGLAYIGETATLPVEFAKLDDDELKRIQKVAATLAAAALAYRAGRPMPTPPPSSAPEPHVCGWECDIP